MIGDVSWRVVSVVIIAVVVVVVVARPTSIELCCNEKRTTEWNRCGKE